MVVKLFNLLLYLGKKYEVNFLRFLIDLVKVWKDCFIVIRI